LNQLIVNYKPEKQLMSQAEGTCSKSTQGDEKSFRSNINSSKAPEFSWISQAVRAGDTIYVSGSLGIDPKTGKFISDDIEGQTVQTLENMKAILEAAGSSFADVVKVTVLLKSINDYSKVNEIYKQYFSSSPPARSAFAVGGIPMNGLIEMDLIAVLSSTSTIEIMSSKIDPEKEIKWHHHPWVKPVVVGGAIGAASLSLAVPMAATALGFTAGGIASGSTAAGIMASYGGSVPIASLCAIGQSIGTTGMSSAVWATTSAVGGFIGGWIGLRSQRRSSL